MNTEQYDQNVFKIIPILFKSFKIEMMISLFLCLFSSAVFLHNDTILIKAIDNEYNKIVKNVPIKNAFTEVSKENHSFTIDFLEKMKSKNGLKTPELVKYNENVNEALEYLDKNTNSGFVFVDKGLTLKDPEIYKIMAVTFPKTTVEKSSSFLTKAFTWYGVLLISLLSIVSTIALLLVLTFTFKVIDAYSIIMLISMLPTIINMSLLYFCFYLLI